MVYRHLCQLLAAACLLVSIDSAAHELFLKPQTSPIAVGTEHAVRLLNGSFDKSENSVTRDRMSDVSILVNGTRVHPPRSAWSDDEKQTLSTLRHQPQQAGTYVIGVSTKPKLLSLPAKEWAQYLRHDGVPDTLAVFEKENLLENVRERYSKHVRTIVQVGEKKTSDFRSTLNYPIEILLDQNPYELKQGDSLSFRVLFQGKPVGNQYVKVSYAGHHAHDAQGNHLSAYQLRTDGDGRARFVVNRKALWYLSLIHMQKIADPEADYESHWATLTFVAR